MSDPHRSVEALFQPFTVKGLTLRNRIAMAPMGRHFAVEGQPSEDYIGYYARRAAGGAGLVTSQATPVPHPAAAQATTYGAFHGERALAVWTGVAKAVHAVGSAYVQQLFHAGALRRPGDQPHADAPPISPSGLYQPPTGAGEPPEALTSPASEAQLADVVAAFGEGAATAQRIGCGGVNLHAAHGYLLDQFFWRGLNRRDDAYGPLPGTRLAEEVIRECRRRVGPDYPIFLRISQWKQQDYGARLCESPRELEAFLRPFVDAGVDLFDCSTRRFWTPEFDGSEMNLAGWTKKLTGLPTMTVGSVGLARDIFDVEAPDPGPGEPPVRRAAINAFAAPARLDRLVEMLERGDFDLVAVGRALISNPNWVNDVRAGRWDSIRPYSVDHLSTLD